MKHFSIFLLGFIVLFGASAAFAQKGSLEIVPQEKKYTRTGADVPDFKKDFTVRKPVIKTKLDQDVRDHIEDAIDFWRAFEMDLNESLTDYTWLESFDHEVLYNANDLLSIQLTAEGSAAYPSTAHRWVTVDTRTGEILIIDDLFTQETQPGLLKLINQKMIANEAAAIKEDPEVGEALKDQRGAYDEDIQPRAGKLDFDDISGFFITEKGVTFVYDYGFPHVMLALEPSGRYEFTFAELKPFVASGSLLEKLVR